jgi:V8-like Glu-specific endopeptidase
MRHREPARTARLALFATSVVALALAGCAEGEVGAWEDLGPSVDSIINGAAYDGDPATVYLMTDGRFMCTASLIAPRVVLTARHCIEHSGARTPASRLSVGTGPQANGSVVYARVTEVRTTSGNMFDGNDIAVLLLDRAGALTPYAWSRTAPTVGEEVVGIGYGQTDGSRRGMPAGRKFRGTGSIGRVLAKEVYTARPLPCYGDSGGPLFNRAGRVIGVVSRGTASTCEGGVGVYTRTDAHAALIDGAIAATGGGGMEPPPAEPPPMEPPPGGMEPPPAEPPPAGAIDICARPYTGTIDVGATLTFTCHVAANRDVVLSTKAPQQILTQVTIEGRTYDPRFEAEAEYRFRRRAVDTPFSVTVRGSNRFRPMPIHVGVDTR